MMERGRQLSGRVFDFGALRQERKPAGAEKKQAAAGSFPEQGGVTPSAADSRRPQQQQQQQTLAGPAAQPRGRAGDVDEQLAALQARIAELKGGRASQAAEFSRLAAAAAALALRATRLRAAARKADLAFAEASKALDLRILGARRTGVDLTDADADEALEAAAAADAAEAAAVAAEEEAIAMDEAARAQLAMAHSHDASHPVDVQREGEATVPRHRPGQPAGSSVTRHGGRPCQARRAMRRQQDEAHEAEATPASPVFKARPVPQSTREPRFERLLNESELARQQRKAEARQRLAAAEQPFSFWRHGGGQQSSQPRPQPGHGARSSTAETQLQSALSRLQDGAARAERALTRTPV
jgi:hypothetical protein